LGGLTLYRTLLKDIFSGAETTLVSKKGVSEFFSASLTVIFAGSSLFTGIFFFLEIFEDFFIVFFT
jgi:hypothetical protein